MPDLVKSLQGRDLGHLRIVAELWGIELDAPEARLGLQRLVPQLLDHNLVGEVVAALPTEARQALSELLSSPDKRMSWALFVRRFGVVREIGPARRDRDRPHLHPASPAEALWYRALVGRAFFDTAAGPEEFAYLPDDLAAILLTMDLPTAGLPTIRQAPLPDLGRAPLGRAATPQERAFIQTATDRILDHACTLLAALRMGLAQEALQHLEAGWNRSFGAVPLTAQALRALLASANMLDPGGVPLPEPTRLFVESSRGKALAHLVGVWLHTERFNELRLLPGVAVEGEWQNDPLRTRQSILDFLATVPGFSAGSDEEVNERVFWSLDSFVAAVRQAYPDFQRPAGDYNSWYLRDEATGEFLRGFESWERVDGALVRFMITGPLYWLGLVDLGWNASPDENPEARLMSFRFSAWSSALLHAQPPEGLAEESGVIQVRSDALLVIPRLVPRAVRYQLARFSEWELEKPDEYQYRLTPRSLGRARLQGLRPNHLLGLLQRHARTVAPSLVRAIERWERLGVEARLAQVLVLRLSSPDLLQIVRNSKAGRFLGEPLGPTAVIVQPGALEKVLAILAELGYLGEVEELNTKGQV